jgi:hypothetical protein
MRTNVSPEATRCLSVEARRDVVGSIGPEASWACPYTAFCAETLAMRMEPRCNWLQSGTPDGGSKPRGEILAYIAAITSSNSASTAA